MQLDEMKNNCSLGSAMNQIGLYQLSNMRSVHRALRILIPDIAILVAAACIYAYLRRVERHQYESLMTSTTLGGPEGGPSDMHRPLDAHDVAERLDASALQRRIILNTLYNLATAVCCILAAIMSASVLSSIYLLVFMACATLWACIRLVERHMNPPRIALLCYTGIHVLLYYLYQFRMAQEALPDGSFPARLLGFHFLFQNECGKPGEIIFNHNVRWTEYVAPPVTFLLFYVLALTTRRALDLQTVVVQERLIYESRDVTNYGTTTDLPLEEQPPPVENTEKPFFLSLITNLIRVSYIVAFLAMMAWSVIYVSWLSFVLLLTACLIWIVPNSRLVCLHISPLVVLYSCGLLLLQYVFAMDLKELPVVYNGVRLETFGMKKFKQPVGVLAIQIGLLCAFWLTLRLYATEKEYAGRRSTTNARGRRMTAAGNLLRLDAAALFGTEENSTYKRLMSILREQFVKLWIIITSLLMLIISTQQPVVMFRVVYMVFFVYFMFTFMISYDFWRKQMLVFWWILIAYSMLVLIGIYTFQFEEVQGFWITVADNATLADIGLQEFEGSALFSRLMTPVIFLIVVIFQVHYFHKDFIRMSTIRSAQPPDPIFDDTTVDTLSHRPSSETSEDFMTDMTSVFQIIWFKIKLLWSKRLVLWRLAEVHLDKVIIVFAAVAALNTISGLWLPLLLIYCIILPFLRSPWNSNICIFLWVSLMILCKMMFQLKSLYRGMQSHLPVNCSLVNLTENPKQDPSIFSVDNLTDWIGLKSAADYRHDINFSLGLVCFVILHMVVLYHQLQWRRERNEPRMMPGIIFPDVKMEDVDKDVFSFIKFLFNHAFFKFGLELTFIVGSIAVAIRADALAMFFLTLTLLLVFLPRHILRRVWGAYCIVLGLTLILEYLVNLGLPVVLCQKYFWTDYFTRIETPKWIVFLNLPDYEYKTPASFLLADFFRFLFACLQMRAFRLESKDNVLRRGGGDNKPVLEDIIPKLGERDFISVKESFMDYAKHGIFMHFFYVSFFILFIAGLMSISLLGLLYLISSFIFLWMGMNLYIRPRRTLVHIWNCVIAYNIIVLLLKCGLQIVGCIYISKTGVPESLQWMTGLFTIKCLNDYSPKGGTTPATPGSSGNSELLANTLTWDVICFSALLIQRKIFVTEIFANVVLDIRVQQKFASRGAAIINSRLIYEVTKQKVQESKMLARIRRKLEKIRLRRQTWGVSLYDEHYKVIRSGDARLFEGDSDEDGEESTLITNAATEGELEGVEPEAGPSARHDDRDDGDPSAPGATVGGEPGSEDQWKIEHRKKRMSMPKICSLPVTERRQTVNPMTIINRVIDSGPTSALEELELSSPTGEARTRKMSVRILEPSRSTDRFSSASDDDDMLESESVMVPGDRKRRQSELDPEENKESCWQNFKATCIIIWKLFNSLIDYLIDRLNHITREYRNIRLTLEAERKLAKRKVKEEGEISALHVDDDSENSDSQSITGGTDAIVTVRDRTVDHKKWKKEVQQLISQVQLAETEFKMHQSRYFLLIVALGNLAGQYWEQLCYLLMVINHIATASVLSMMYPFLIFIWGMLSVPRPSKLFWSTVITYTMVVIIVKYTFQFHFPILTHIASFDESVQLRCFNLGLDRNTNFATLDLIQLMVVFIHRGFLKANGLWRAVADTHGEMMGLAKRYGQLLGHEEPRQDVVVNAQREASSSSSPTPAHPTDRTDLEESAKHFYQTPVHNIRRFFEKMTDPLFNMRVDVYTPMFFCEFVGLLILVFCYQYFVPYAGADENVASYIRQSKIPIPFLVMCLVQFIIIIIDRALFLQKLVFGKLIFHFFMMIAIHIWMFLALPCFTNREFTNNLPAQIFYFLKCIYFGLSAYQIRSGYPVRVLGNFFTKSYNYANLFLYKGFFLVPFLMDLRCMMDWIWTETSLGLYHWNQMEHIYSIIFVVKCWHYSEDIMPTPRGKRRNKCAKYGLGGLVVGLIILAIWLPMLVFSIMGATATPTLPIECEAALSVGGFTPIYKATAQSSRLLRIDKDQYTCLRRHLINDKQVSALSRFQPEDLEVIRMDENSSVIWSITPPGRDSLIAQLNSTTSTEFSLSCKRRGYNLQSSVSGLFKHILNTTESQALIVSIQANQSKGVPAKIFQVYPRFVVLEKDTIKYDRLLSQKVDWVNLTVSKESREHTQWWRIKEVEYSNFSECLGIDNQIQPYIITMNERAYTTNVITSFLAGYGIIGLYVVFVIWFANLIRRVLFCSDTLRFDDMPYVDRILTLCKDIYMVREHKDWELEEELYSKLDYLWRSPETMIKYTKPKAE